MAIGSPLRVTRIGSPFFFTFFSSLRQVALNLDIGIVSGFMRVSMDFLKDDISLLPWSVTIVNDREVG